MSNTDVPANSGNEESSDIYANSGQPRVRPHQNPETLQNLYHEEGLTQAEIGKRLGVDQSTISKWMRIYEIETEPPAHKRGDKKSGIYRSVDEHGKVNYIADIDGEPERLLSEHQLVALHDFHVAEVFDETTHVHHLMAAPYALDLPENLLVLDGREHQQRHAEGTATSDPRVILAHIFGEFEPQIGSPDDGDCNEEGEK